MINKRQYNILSFYLTRALFLGGGFTFLIKLSKNDFLVASILGMLLGYFLLYLFFKKGSVNKWMCCIVASSVLILEVLANTILTSDYLLFTTPTLLIVLVIILSLIYASKKEFKVIGRVVEVFAFFSLIVVGLSLLFLFGLIKVDRILPLFTTETINIIKSIIVFAGTSVLPNILLINYKDELKFRDVHLGYIFGCILIIVIFFFIITIYGSEFASMVRFPEFLILKKIDVMGYLSNVENVLVTEWMFNVLISSWVCVKVLRDSMNKKWFYILIILLIMVNEFLLNRNYVNILYVKQYSNYIIFGLVLVSLIIKKRKN